MHDTSSYLSEIEAINYSEQSFREKLFALKQLLERLCKSITHDEPMQFPTLFSRIVFVSQKFDLEKQTEWHLQNLRVKASELRNASAPYFGSAQQPLSDRPNVDFAESAYRRVERAVITLCLAASGKKTVSAENAIATSKTSLLNNTFRAHLLKIDRVKKILIVVPENSPETELTVKYNDRICERFWENAQLNLINCTIDKKGYFTPKHIVLEPDYLIDASAIAECFQDYAVSPLHYFRNKFEGKENRSYLLLGNLANFFLDELIFAQNIDDVKFDDVFLQSFKQSPFEYTSCEDIRSIDDFRAFMEKAQQQFDNIRRVIKEDFPRRGIDVHQCTLEPSFFSEKFGFQGRLDLLHANANDAHIVELKSGKLPYPQIDTGKIALNHEVQTAVYRLMVESVFGKDARQIDAAILYSAGNTSGENLRFSAVYQELEKEIANVRNAIIANEYVLMQGDNEQVRILFEELFQSTKQEKLPSFFVQKIEKIRATLSQCREWELDYFFRYIRFISRELYLQKIGDAEYESPTGLASLWNSDFSERAEALDVLFNLSVSKIDDSGNDMTILFVRNQTDNDIVNFREGEICIVYPRQFENDTVLNTQILKGTIVRIAPESVEVRFRYKQKNRTFFDTNPLWAIEHDTLDSSYNSMYKSLFSFLESSVQKRDLLLGVSLNANSFLNANYANLRKSELLATQDTISETQACVNLRNSRNLRSQKIEDIVKSALAAQDYFLIVGPPGTGKTSIFARRLIEEYHKDLEKNILVLAYTNRAVDELCEAVNAAFGCADGECDMYIRMGTELSCAESYRHRLLQNISENAPNRSALRQEIEDTRIFISTLASINGRQELFNLKHFHVAIIDEASQILEPQLIGLLPRFDKFVMIGDHNQLSTIVLQKPHSSEIREPKLRKIGITDCRDSLFERLLCRCIENEWTNSYTQLTHQGRMHADIAAFPAKFFYNENLFPVLDWQLQEWKLNHSTNDIYHKSVANERTMFFSTEKQYRPSSSNKINETEAEIAVKLVQSIREVYEENEIAFDTQKIGIIAPYRNQIALIRHQLSQAKIPDFEKIMVDTVERFQGSQRDVIIVSFCVNKPYQLDFLCNLNHNGTVDRKLNVALTRARQQLFLIGNAQILKQHPIYAMLLDFYKDNLVVV
jgi:DNA replication ATP-dependent helicase Dna2